MANKGGWGRDDDEPSGLRLEQARFDPEFAKYSPTTVTTISTHHLIYSLAGLILGLVCVVGGIVLFLNGVAGSTSWTAKMLGAESEISDAAPGAVLFIVGLFIVFVTRYVVKVQK